MGLRWAASLDLASAVGKKDDMANVLGLLWVIFAVYVGLVSVRNRRSQTGKFTINILIAVLYVIIGVVSLLFGHLMAMDQQLIFLAFTFAGMYVTWEMLQLL